MVYEPGSQGEGRLLVPNPIRSAMRIDLDYATFSDPIQEGANGASKTTQANLNFILKSMQVA